MLHKVMHRSTPTLKYKNECKNYLLSKEINSLDFSVTELIEIAYKIRFLELMKEFNTLTNKPAYRLIGGKIKKVDVDPNSINLIIPNSIEEFNIFTSVPYVSGKIVILSKIVNGAAYFMFEDVFNSLFKYENGNRIHISSSVDKFTSFLYFGYTFTDEKL